MTRVGAVFRLMLRISRSGAADCAVLSNTSTAWIAPCWFMLFSITRTGMCKIWTQFTISPENADVVEMFPVNLGRDAVFTDCTAMLQRIRMINCVQRLQ